MVSVACELSVIPLSVAASGNGTEQIASVSQEDNSGMRKEKADGAESVGLCVEGIAWKYPQGLKPPLIFCHLRHD
jgi:hypothetical protein